jgi:hypothetical protein
MTEPKRNEPLLRTLAPALAHLHADLRSWLAGPHRYPLGTISRAALEGIDADLRRQSEALDVDRPLLMIVLMGGTGVGKSTLLNALAGGTVAQASFARPTTRDPVVYYHESIKPDRLDPALRQCRLAPHDRPELEYKVLVDTPDLDSNDLSNRDKLGELLPVADVVLYVGSQEKYHDKLGWELFLEQRRRRAFAFVLNKWDRCQNVGSGLRPDEDLLHDLKAQGFENPLLFRTCAQYWAANPGAGSGAAEAERNGAPPGDQFDELVTWLEKGLTRLEIEAIKARGVGQLLGHLETTLKEIEAPDLTAQAASTRSGWEKLLDAEAAATAEILVNTLEPYQKEIEHHFAIEAQQRFHGMMASYLKLFTRARYVGSTLRDRVPLIPRLGARNETPASLNLSEFTAACTKVAGERHLDGRARALANRLLVDASEHDYPVTLLAEPTEAATAANWRQRYAELLIGGITEFEQRWSKPTGVRRWVQWGTIWLANHLPLYALFASFVFLLWRYTINQEMPALGDMLLPIMIVFIVLVILHIAVSLVLPMKWPAMRSDFERRLDRGLREELTRAYGPIPEQVARELLEEKRRTQALLQETREVASWLTKREQAAQIDSLYGSP